MPDEMKLLRDLRPTTKEPAPDASERAREALLSKIAADAGGRRRRARFLRGHPFRRWVVPCIAVVGLAGGGAGLAAGLGDWWTSADPPVRSDEVAAVLDFGSFPPTASGRVEPDVARAATVAYAPGAALVAAPTARGGYCLVFVPDGSKPSFNCLEFDGGAGQVDDFFSRIEIVSHELSWYLVGRVVDEGAARMELFQHVTHPFEESGAETLPGTPLGVDVGPGGFFLARVPHELWSGLDLAYGQVTVLDGDGAPLSRSCRFLGATPDSSLTRSAGGSAGDPLATSAESAASYPCPATGVAAESVRMRPTPPRAQDLAGVAGRDVRNGERIELSSFSGRPLLIAVWDPHSPTAARLIGELDEFAQRHPEAQIVGVLTNRHAASAGRRAVESLALSFPTILVDAFATDATTTLLHGPGGRGPHVLVLDSGGRVAVELATPSRGFLSFYSLVTQETLEKALVSATD
jgi:hypothetical protein